MLTCETSFQESQAPETQGKDWNKEDSPLVEGHQSGENVICKYVATTSARGAGWCYCEATLLSLNGLGDWERADRFSMLQTSQPHFHLRESDGENPPGKHFQTHEGQESIGQRALTAYQTSPAGWERWPLLSVQNWWGCVWNTVSSSGPCSTRKIRTYWSECGAGLQRSLTVWSIWQMRGWSSWNSSAWRREGSWGILMHKKYLMGASEVGTDSSR